MRALVLLALAGCYVMPDPLAFGEVAADEEDDAGTAAPPPTSQVPVSSEAADAAVTTTCPGYGAAPLPSEPFGTLLAVGVAERTLRSSDGAAWTSTRGAQDGDAAAPRDLRGVVRAEGRFVAAASSGILTSADGVSWQAATLPEVRKYVSYDSGFDAVAYGKGRFVASAAPRSNPAAFYWSDDGVIWQPPTVVSESVHGLSISAVTFANDRFVAVGSGARTLVSDDGKTWHDDHQNGNDRQRYTGVVYGKGRWVAVGNVIPQSSGAGAGAPALFAHSTDGKTWKDASSPDLVGLFGGVLFDGDRFVTCARVGCYASDTGEHWAALPGSIGEPRPTAALVHAGGVYFGLDAPATVLTSTDASAWTPVYCGEAPLLTALTLLEP